MKHLKIITLQIVFLVIIGIGIYAVYPKAEVKLSGNTINFKTINANAIAISDNPEFSNARYVKIEDNVSLNLKPGTYYWKASNGVIQGFANIFVVESEVGMEIQQDGNESELVNVGNVKINVTKQSGGMVGHIILEPDEEETIENKDEEYTGRQE